MPPLKITSPTIVHHMAALDPLADEQFHGDQPAPPNSLEAIQECLDAGAAIIELDVTALADSDYLLVHDLELEAETSGVGVVEQYRAEDARKLFIKQHGNLTAYRAAVLSDAVKLVENHSGTSRLQLDFKNVIPLPNDEPLLRLTKLIEPLGDRVIVSTGADWQLRKLRKLAPWLMLGFDIMWYIDWQPENAERDPRAFPKQRGAYDYYDDHMLASARLWSTAEYLRDRCESLMGLVPDVSVFYLEHPLIVKSLEDGFNWAEALHSGGIMLDAWTMDVTDPVVPSTAPRLLAAGVDMFTTNTPRAFAKLLAA